MKTLKLQMPVYETAGRAVKLRHVRTARRGQVHPCRPKGRRDFRCQPPYIHEGVRHLLKTHYISSSHHASTLLLSLPPILLYSSRRYCLYSAMHLIVGAGGILVGIFPEVVARVSVDTFAPRWRRGAGLETALFI